MGLKIRFGGIVILLFMAIFFDFRDLHFQWEMVGGVCEEVYIDQIRSPQEYNPSSTLNEKLSPAYKTVAGQFVCGDGSINIPIPKASIFFDLPTILLIWMITFLVVYSRRTNRIKMWEEASHVVKDVSELGAAIGAIMVFWGQFSERSMSIGFGVCLGSYFVGLATALFLKTYAEHLKRKELTETINDEQTTQL